MSRKVVSKAIFTLLIATIIGIIVASQAHAQSATGAFGIAVVNGKNAGKVHLREFSSTNSKSLGLYFTGTKVLCESSPNDEWVIVSIGSQFGYMKSAFLSLNEYDVQSKQPVGRVQSKNGASVNLRAEPSLQAAIVENIQSGNTAIIQGETDTHWYYVQVGDQFGYIQSKFVKIGNNTSAIVKPIQTAPPTLPQVSRPRIVGYTFHNYVPTSTICIQYPVFYGDQVEMLNKQVYAKTRALGEYGNNNLTANYQCMVTFYNTKIISMVFWGDAVHTNASYPMNMLTTYNIDLAGLKELRLSDLFILESSFESIFFSKAFFPTDPITSYDPVVFSEMLKLQSKEYLPISPFSISNNVSFFLKPDGVVFSMPAVHATGSDHFEAQLSYRDVRNYYRLNDVYWID